MLSDTPPLEISPERVSRSFHKHIGAVTGIERPPQGCNFSVAIVTASRGRFVVKTGDTSEKIAALSAEAQVLTALSPYQPFVPRFVAQDDGLFLFTCIEGMNLAVLFAEADGDTARRHRLAAEFGRTLRQIHGWTPRNLPLPARDWISETMTRCLANVREGRITGILSEHSIFDGSAAETVAAEVAAERDRYQSEITFCHGDWCLPNALGIGDTVVGVIDWSAGGSADYRFDLATALWTLRYNTGGDLVCAAYLETFLRAYGYAGDVDSLRFFEALYILY